MTLLNESQRREAVRKLQLKGITVTMRCSLKTIARCCSTHLMIPLPEDEKGQALLIRRFLENPYEAPITQPMKPLRLSIGLLEAMKKAHAYHQHPSWFAWR